TPTRAWNALTTLVFALKASWLQRGHAHAGVECRGTFKTRIQIRRFNGATPTRAWNGFLSPTRRPFSPCFNGATPTRAWNDGNGGEIALTMGALQRGHAHAGVECVWVRPVRTGENCCFNGATPTRAWNVNGRGVGVLGDDPLQRGHAHAGVECVHAVRDPRGVKRFNGATPTRAWNARAAPSTTSSPLSLQRGHAHAGVE